MQHSISNTCRFACTASSLILLLGNPVSAQQLADPTRPYSSSDVAKRIANQPRQLRVQAIYRFNEQRLAIIDGTLVHEGDRIATLTIEKITDTQVSYLRNGSRGVLRLAQEPSSVTPATVMPTAARISSIRSEVTP